MKAHICLILIFALISPRAHGQGVFFAANSSAPTRVGAIDGPLAGTNILGQMFEGPSAESLTPIGMPAYHRNGQWGLGNIPVPNVPPYNFAYVQLVAWDSTLWGTMLAGVPADQLGRTDVVTVLLTTGVFPDGTLSPHFTQPAIVPIPEPSVWVLGLLTGGLALVSRFARRHVRRPKQFDSADESCAASLDHNLHTDPGRARL